MKVNYIVAATGASAGGFEAFDLVISDQSMSNLSGAELAAQMLKTRPNVPIILCTGFSSVLTVKKRWNWGYENS